MKVKKSFLALILMSAIGGGILSSCSDNDSPNGSPSSAVTSFDKNSEAAVTLRSILGYTAGIDSLPDNWTKNSYIEDATIGEVKDPSTPLVRYMAVSGMEDAINQYNNLTMQALDTTATSKTWSMDSVGTISYQAYNQKDLYATIKFNVDHLRLEELRLVPASVLGNNASVDFSEIYYHTGDVVVEFEQKDSYGNIDYTHPTYWTCVRACDGVKKKQSHWVSFQLLPSNLVGFRNDENNNIKAIVPRDLSTTERFEDVQNAYKFFHLICDANAKNDYADPARKSMYKKGLDDMGLSKYPAKDIDAIISYWNNRSMIDKIKPLFMETNDFKNAFTGTNPVNFFHYTYARSSTSKGQSVFTLYTASFNAKSDDGQELNSSNKSVKFKFDMNHNFDIRSYAYNATGQYENYDNSYYAAQNVPQSAFVIRVKTGSQLCGDTEIKNEDYLNPFSKYNKATQDYLLYQRGYVYHYDYTIFGIYADPTDNSKWICLSSPEAFDPLIGFGKEYLQRAKYIFISFDNIKVNTPDNTRVTSEDLPTEEQAIKALRLIITATRGVGNLDYSEVSDNYAIEQHLKRVLNIPLRRLCKTIAFRDAANLEHHTDRMDGFITVSCAYKGEHDAETEEQSVMRQTYYNTNNAAGPAGGTVYVRTKYPNDYALPMYLSDIKDQQKVNLYTHIDSLTFEEGGFDYAIRSANYGQRRTAAPAGTDVTSYILNDGVYAGYDPLSMYNDPMLIFRYKEYRYDQKDNIKLRLISTWFNPNEYGDEKAYNSYATIHLGFYLGGFNEGASYLNQNQFDFPDIIDE